MSWSLPIGRSGHSDDVTTNKKTSNEITLSTTTPKGDSEHSLLKANGFPRSKQAPALMKFTMEMTFFMTSPSPGTRPLTARAWR
ncbi:hypothetical protein T11_5361 [Trichinella zimbabwensis]|uniref:Uncharacterized protein n=1 Tax=Trichinella zimbabwensis TaxID=268475 RepID=A0A0V1HYQ5_9BILA|nr:hypothetical protein T11_5361 [Trichinella zimbabwensis]